MILLLFSYQGVRKPRVGSTVVVNVTGSEVASPNQRWVGQPGGFDV